MNDNTACETVNLFVITATKSQRDVGHPLDWLNYNWSLQNEDSNADCITCEQTLLLAV